MPDRRTFYFTHTDGRAWSIRCSKLLGIEANVDGKPVGAVKGEAVRQILEAKGSPADKANELMDAIADQLPPGALAQGEDALLDGVIAWVRVVAR